MNPDPQNPSKPTRENWFVTKCDSIEDMEKVHLQQWQSVSGSVRAAAAWEMVVEAWKLKKRDLNELRFQRTVTSIQRSQG